MGYKCVSIALDFRLGFRVFFAFIILEILTGHKKKAEDAPGILRREAGDGACPVNTKGGKGFQISLNTRATTAIRAGNGKGNWQSLSFRHADSIDENVRR